VRSYIIWDGFILTQVFRQVEAKNKKRKEKALRVREQSEQKKVKEQRRERKRQKILQKSNIRQSDGNQSSTDAHVNAEDYSFLSGGPLPALLPDSILAAEPEQAWIELPEDLEVTQPPKSHHFFAQHKLPRVVKRGSFAVRVLDKESPLLPPRASKNSMNLKENWLRNRRGRKRGQKEQNDIQWRRLGVVPFLRNT
jgi:U3 small nucleolar RNA-associated protein 16